MTLHDRKYLDVSRVKDALTDTEGRLESGNDV